MMVEEADCIVGSMAGFGDSMVDVAVVVVVVLTPGVVDEEGEDDEGAGREMMYVQISILKH